MPDRNPFEETRRAGMNVPQRAVETPTRGMRGQLIPPPPRQVEDVFDPGRLYDIFDPRRLGGDAGSGYDIFDPRRIEGEYDIFDPRRLGGGGGGGRSAYLSSRFGGGLDDIFAMNDNARGMVEDTIPGAFDVAELSGQQQDWMNSPIGTPDFYSNFDDYFNAVTRQEDEGTFWPEILGGRGAQEPATQQEVIDYFGESYVDEEGRPKTLPWSVTT